MAALFWADAYTYMKSAQAAGEEFTLADYSTSLKNRLSGRPDAASLRRERREEQRKAEEAAKMAGKRDPHRRIVGDAPRFTSIEGEDDQRQERTRGFLDGLTGGGKSGGALNHGSALSSGGIKFVTARD